MIASCYSCFKHLIIFVVSAYSLLEDKTVLTLNFIDICMSNLTCYYLRLQFPTVISIVFAA